MLIVLLRNCQLMCSTLICFLLSAECTPNLSQTRVLLSTHNWIVGKRCLSTQWLCVACRPTTGGHGHRFQLGDICCQAGEVPFYLPPVSEEKLLVFNYIFDGKSSVPYVAMLWIRILLFRSWRIQPLKPGLLNNWQI